MLRVHIILCEGHHYTAEFPTTHCFLCGCGFFEQLVLNTWEFKAIQNTVYILSTDNGRISAYLLQYQQVSNHLKTFFIYHCSRLHWILNSKVLYSLLIRTLILWPLSLHKLCHLDITENRGGWEDWLSVVLFNFTIKKNPLGLLELCACSCSVMSLSRLRNKLDIKSSPMSALSAFLCFSRSPFLSHFFLVACTHTRDANN